VHIQGFRLEQVVNPFLGPLPAALFVGAGCLYAARGRMPYLALATVAWAFGLQVHLAFAFGVVALAVLVAWSPRESEWKPL